jgi:hypothetical protein
MAARKQKKPAELRIPEPLAPRSWLVLGLDLSLSRTGFALLHVTPEAANIVVIGSVKPVDASAPVWLRSLATGQVITEILRSAAVAQLLKTGSEVILSFEAPTPRNDYLTSINRVLNTVLLGPGSPLTGRVVRNLYINASTLRSYMGLVQRGAANKKENKAKAYTYISEEKFPGLDTDSCDAVLMAVVGQFAARILMAQIEQVPVQFVRMLCDATPVVKGRPGHERIALKGLMNNPLYWFEHQEATYELMLRNAAIKSVRATKIALVI